MSDSHTSLEPLADYLEPQFGNIYDWDNTVVPYVDEDGFDVQPWTDEVRQAIKNYLLHEAPEHLLELALPHRKGTHPEKWVDGELESRQPWEVAHLFHEAAVTSLPTLDVLIGHLQTWPYEDDRDDATYWLEQHATDSQLNQIGIASKRADLAQSDTSDLAFYLLRRLEPPALLKAWHDVSDSAQSDLTDAEWQLIEPFIPGSGRAGRYVSRKRLSTARAAINGMLYRSAEGGSWSFMPARYGAGPTIRQRYIKYWRNGIFAQMLEALHDHPEATRLVEWLRLGQHARL